MTIMHLARYKRIKEQKATKFGGASKKQNFIIFKYFPFSISVVSDYCKKSRDSGVLLPKTDNQAEKTQNRRNKLHDSLFCTKSNQKNLSSFFPFQPVSLIPIFVSIGTPDGPSTTSSTQTSTFHMDYITSAELFDRQPQSAVFVDNFYDASFVSRASIGQLLDLTHAVITSGELSVSETLRVWELRLTLHLFDGHLSTAKIEAINLNRSIHLHENPDQSRYPQNQTGLRSSATALGPGATGAAGNVQYVYPLPRNNSNEIPYLLLLLLLRLKSSPSMSMVNECYRMCYQLRLRGQALENQLLQSQLIQLAYLISVQLVITKNTLTLVSFLDSLLISLKDQLRIASSEKVLKYVENITFAQFLARALAILRHSKDPAVQDVQFEALRPAFDHQSPSAINSLRFALNNWASHVAAPPPEEKITMDMMTFDEIITMIKSGRLSTRIVCCTLAVWDLGSAFNSSVDDDELLVEVSKNGDRFDDVYAVIMSRWAHHGNRVFCIE